MKTSILLLVSSLLICACAGSAAANTPTPVLHQVKYVYASDENFCMAKVTVQPASGERKEYILFPNGAAAEIGVSLAEGQTAWMQADYMTSTQDQPCQLICRIYLDGMLWQESKASGTKGTQVACQGVVGQK